MIELADNKQNLVIKRDGREEPYDSHKMYQVLLWATDNNESLVQSILDAIDIKIYNRIPIQVLFDEVIDTTSNLISRLTPQYEAVARNLYLLKQYKELWGLNKDNYPTLRAYFGRFKKYLTSDINKFTPTELVRLDKAIKPERDKLSTFLGLQVFFEKYSINNEELLQHGYMRMAIQPYLYYPVETRINKIIDRYNHLSLGYYTEATPKFKNSLRKKFYGASCCVHKMDDNTESINGVTSDIGQYSRADGGNAVDISDIRASGSLIGTVGKSNGPVPFVKQIEASVNAYNQNGTRPGVCAIYYPWWHSDVMDLLPLMDEGGKENQRARALKFGIKLNRLFLRAIQKDDYVYLFDPKVVPEFNNTYGEQFEELYEDAVANNKYSECIKARTVALAIAKERLETGNLYIFFIENVNENTPFKDMIYSSNLCVSGDTKILTRDGYKPIKSISGTKQELWNGIEWSLSNIVKTSDNSHVLKVKLSNGQEIEATDYHKWYVIEQNKWGGFIKNKEVRTNELKIGDKLMKFNLEPITHGDKELDLAYVNGFYTDDGTNYHTSLGDKPKIDIHDDKQLLISRFSGYKSSNYAKGGRILTLNYSVNSLKPKFFIPDSSYSIESRLRWLEGYFDADGTLTDNNGTESIQIVSVEHEFIKNLQLMLQELGIHSKIIDGLKAGYRKLPANDGSGRLKDYWCKKSYRLLIAGSQLNHLIDLGYKASRVMPTTRKYNREAMQFVKVIDIIDEDKYIETYCANEPLEHKIMLNGVLTGNCNEIFLPTKATKYSKKVVSKVLNKDKYITQSNDEIGLTALCNLSSINVEKWYNMNRYERLDLMQELMESSDNLIDIQSYPTPEGELFNRNYRAIGIGMTNLAYLFASKGVKFSSQEALDIMKDISRTMRGTATAISAKLSIERGSFEWIDKTNLTQRRFATTSAIPPSATSALISGFTEGIEPLSKLISEKTGTYSSKQLAPKLKELGQNYELASEIPTKALYDLAAIRQKYLLDQGQSINTYVKDPTSAYEVINDIIYAESIGLKGLYYLQSNTAVEICDSCGA